LKIDILTIFPGYFESPLAQSVLGRALMEGRCEVRVVDFRAFSTDKHGKVDDKPFGGGPGMVLTLQPIVDCLETAIKRAEAEGRNPKLIMTTCRGRTLAQPMIDDWLSSAENGLIIVCGHYEDFDARLFELFDFEEVSLGDFVLSGGEPVALCIVDALIRKLPGVVGNPDSVREESFETGFLDYPSYTRPVDFRGLKVPDVLLSGNHALIEEWRRDMARKLTARKRPDLLEKYLKPEGEK
jgi:tRNA (guanine37-N1)-methyltransferase